MQIQDCIPTCATIYSQKLALACLLSDEHNLSLNRPSFVASKVQALRPVREAVWTLLQQNGGNIVKPNGAFYFLVPVPKNMSDRQTVDILATQFGVLLMPGESFGAPGFMRLSYGSLDPEQMSEAIERLRTGLRYLQKM
jgi:aspartate/methionine/tyrosine aminotransferase